MRGENARTRAWTSVDERVRACPRVYDSIGITSPCTGLRFRSGRARAGRCRRRVRHRLGAASSDTHVTTNTAQHLVHARACYCIATNGRSRAIASATWPPASPSRGSLPPRPASSSRPPPRPPRSISPRGGPSCRRRHLSSHTDSATSSTVGSPTISKIRPPRRRRRAAGWADFLEAREAAPEAGSRAAARSEAPRAAAATRVAVGAAAAVLAGAGATAGSRARAGAAAAAAAAGAAAEAASARRAFVRLQKKGCVFSVCRARQARETLPNTRVSRLRPTLCPSTQNWSYVSVIPCGAWPLRLYARASPFVDAPEAPGLLACEPCALVDCFLRGGGTRVS